MLHFLRKIRKSLVSQGTGKKYLIYAIGEIALVVIGILIALQINNWNNNKISNNAEKEILTEMRTSVLLDLQNLNSRLNMLQLIESRIEKLQEIIKSGEEVDSIDVLCGAVYGIQRFDLNTASFEELKSNGFNLISDDNMRRLIIKIFDTHLKKIDHHNKIEDNVILEALRPYYLANFSEIRFTISATPNDIRTVYTDKYYHNLIDYRLTVVKSLSLFSYPVIIKDMTELVNQIDIFLGDTGE